MGKALDGLVILLHTLSFSFVATAIAGFFIGMDKCYSDKKEHSAKACGVRDEVGGSTHVVLKPGIACPANATRLEKGKSMAWTDYICPPEPADLSEVQNIVLFLSLVYIILMFLVFLVTLLHDCIYWLGVYAASLNFEENFSSLALWLFAANCFYCTVLVFAVIAFVKDGEIRERIDFSHNCVCSCQWRMSTVKQLQACTFAGLAFLLPMNLIWRMWTQRQAQKPAYLSVSYAVPLQKVYDVYGHGTVNTPVL